MYLVQRGGELAEGERGARRAGCPLLDSDLYLALDCLLAGIPSGLACAAIYPLGELCKGAQATASNTHPPSPFPQLVMASRRLLHELQTLLAQLPALRTLPIARPPPSLLRRAFSSPTASDLFATATSSRQLSSLVEESPAPANIFESTNDEYQAIPLSTLDYPVPSRSPDDALLALLDSKQYTEADALLHEFQEAGQAIPHQLRFAHHAEALAKADLGSDWLKWWALSPTVASYMTASSSHMKTHLRRLDAHAERIVERLLEEQFQDWHRLRHFAVLLARQGHSRVVSERLLVHFAAYAPEGMAEELWIETLGAVRVQMADLATTSDVVFRTRKAMTKERRFRSKSQPWERVAQGLSPRAWLVRRTVHEVDLLGDKRQRMLRVHANYGRLDYAVELLQATRDQWRIAGRALRLHKSTYLALLSSTASADRFDLFSQVYAGLEAHRARLTRVRKGELRLRDPYFVRGVDYDAPDAIPSAKEAFSTWRYSSFVGALEEGGLTEPSSPTSTSELDYKTALLAELEARPFNFRRASKNLLAMIAHEQYPLPRDTARFIRLARQAQQDEFLLSLDGLFDPRAGASRRLANYWTTSMMLSHVQQQEWNSALRLFTKFYDLSCLSAELQQAFRTFAPHTRKIAVRSRIPVDAYVFSVAVQALIPTIEPQPPSTNQQRTPSSSSATRLNPLITRLFHSLLADPPRVIPYHSSSSSSGRPTSPLDPHTFTPILSALFRHTPRPSSLLNSLLALLQHGVNPTKQHYGLLLASYARRAPPRDVLFLLSILDPSPSPSAPAQPSDELLAQLQGMGQTIFPSLEERGGPLDVVAYTGVVVGLMKQGEWPAAREVVSMAQGRGFERDARWRVVVGRLGKRDGLGGVVPARVKAESEGEGEERELERVMERLSV